MSVHITAIYGSPRKGGNTDILMRAFLAGVHSAGCAARELYLRNFRLYPCTACGDCLQSGCCVLQDDMEVLYRYFEESDVLVLAAPVYFYGFGAMAKAMIDRCQCFWVRKYRLRQDMNAGRPSGSGRGILLSVGGSGGSRNFEGVLLSARYFFDALDMKFAHHLTYGSVDEAGAILRHPSACEDAEKLGRKVVTEVQTGT
jgi:multimeric flavodoxin WrbA